MYLVPISFCVASPCTHFCAFPPLISHIFTFSLLILALVHFIFALISLIHFIFAHFSLASRANSLLFRLFLHYYLLRF